MPTSEQFGIKWIYVKHCVSYKGPYCKLINIIHLTWIFSCTVMMFSFCDHNNGAVNRIRKWGAKPTIVGRRRKCFNLKPLKTPYNDILAKKCVWGGGGGHGPLVPRVCRPCNTVVSNTFVCHNTLASNTFVLRCVLHFLNSVSVDIRYIVDFLNSKMAIKVSHKIKIHL